MEDPKRDEAVEAQGSHLQILCAGVKFDPDLLGLTKEQLMEEEKENATTIK